MGTRMFAIVKDMLKSVYNLNEMSLSDMLEAAFEMYPVRVVCADIIAPMMWEIGSMWERGEIMVVMEHFASNVVIAKLKALLHKQNTTTNAKGPVVIVGCAPEEFHEIGALIVSFFMSLNGWKVVYLGQNVPPTDVMNIVDTMDVHTVALSASSERSLSSLKLIGQHIASRAKRKKVEYLVGGRLLKLDDNMLSTIPAATTRSADDLYIYCPPTHPTHQDTMVRGALDGSYSLIRESYRKMRLASERRKRTQYLLDQITDDGAGGEDKGAELDDMDDAELTQTLEKILNDAVGKIISGNGDCGDYGDYEGKDCGLGPTITELPDDADEGEKAGKDNSSGPLLLKDSPEATGVKEYEGPEESTKTTKATHARKSPETTTTTTTATTDTVAPKETKQVSPTEKRKSTSPKETEKEKGQGGKRNEEEENAGGEKEAKTTKREKMDIKERLEKQRQQTQAMKEMLQKYKDEKKLAEQNIIRSRAILNENRLISAKKKPVPPVVPTLQPSNHPPATPFVLPAGGNRLVSYNKQGVKPTTTKFLHMNDPATAALPNTAEKDDPYYPKYTNLPVLNDTRDSSSASSTSLSDDEQDALEEGVA